MFVTISNVTKVTKDIPCSLSWFQYSRFRLIRSIIKAVLSRLSFKSNIILYLGPERTLQSNNVALYQLRRYSFRENILHWF